MEKVGVNIKTVGGAKNSLTLFIMIDEVPQPTTTVVNIRNSTCDQYIGRGSTFGNPYHIGEDGDREQVIEKFRAYFYKRLTDASFRDKVLALKGKRLGCWCVPLNCHGNVIVEYLEKL